MIKGPSINYVTLELSLDPSPPLPRNGQKIDVTFFLEIHDPYVPHQIVQVTAGKMTLSFSWQSEKGRDEGHFTRSLTPKFRENFPPAASFYE